MAKLLHPLLMVVARATDRELARMVDYLKAENEILRARLPKRIVTTPRRGLGWSKSASRSERPSRS
jgi:hypothetical protein